MELDSMTITLPVDGNIFKWTDTDADNIQDIPPNITLAGTTSNSPTGMFFKWWSTNPKKDTINGYWNAFLNFDELKDDNGSVYEDAKTLTWNKARVGTQYIKFFAKDQLIINAVIEDIETALKAVTKQWMQGGSVNVDLNNDETIDVHKLKIHVLRARILVPNVDTYVDTPRYFYLPAGLDCSGTCSMFYIGAECRVEPFADGETDIDWGTAPHDDELVYKVEISDASEWVEIWNSSTDKSQYKVTDGTTEEEGSGVIGFTVTQYNGTMEFYRLSVTKGSEVVYYQFTISIGI